MKRATQQTTTLSASADGKSPRYIEACNNSLTVKISNDAAITAADRRHGKTPKQNQTDSFETSGRGRSRQDYRQQSRTVGSGRLSAAYDNGQDGATVVAGSVQKQHVIKSDVRRGDDGVSGRYQKGRKRNPHQRRKPLDGSAADGITAASTDGRPNRFRTNSQRKDDSDKETGLNQSNEDYGDRSADDSASAVDGNRIFRSMPQRKPQQARQRRVKSPVVADAGLEVASYQTVSQESVVTAAKAETQTCGAEDSNELLEQTVTVAGCDEMSSNDRKSNGGDAAAEFGEVEKVVSTASSDSSPDDEDQWEDVEEEDVDVEDEDDEDEDPADAFEDSVCEVEMECRDAVEKPHDGDKNIIQQHMAAGSHANGGGEMN